MKRLTALALGIALGAAGGFAAVSLSKSFARFSTAEVAQPGLAVPSTLERRAFERVVGLRGYPPSRREFD